MVNRVLGRLGDKAHELAGVCTFVLVKPVKQVTEYLRGLG